MSIFSSSRPASPEVSGSNSSSMRILVAVDFGTTFSSVAFANTVEPNKQKIIDDWGSGPRRQNVPSALKYNNGGTTGPLKYGFQALRDRNRGGAIHEWFKLGLCPEVKNRRAISSSLRQFIPQAALGPVQGEECENLVISYLTMLGQATDGYLKKNYDSAIYKLSREYIVTVPAIWSPRAQNATQNCAADALMTDRNSIQVIAEPEAAAVYALATMTTVGLREGETFVICDAGGGTIDLASYKIKSLIPQIKLVGVSTPSGGLCGSSFLNKIFEEYLKKLLRGYVDRWEGRNQRWLNSMLQYFEDPIKTEFTGMEPDGYMYELEAYDRRDSSEHGIRGEVLRISATAIRERVFNPVIAEVQALVRKHIDSTENVRAVLLAGGFGQNKYLKSKLELVIPGSVDIWEIEDSRTAIVRGALIAGLPEVERRARKDGQRYSGDEEGEQGIINVRVVSRRAPKHFGVPAFEIYNSSNPLHKRGEGRVVRFKNGEKKLQVMKWFIDKNQDIEDGVPKTFGLSYENEVLKVHGSAVIQCKIYAFDGEMDRRPEYPHTDKYPNASIQIPLVTLKIELNEDDLAKLPTEVIKGVGRYMVDFDVRMTLSSAKMTFVLCRGEREYEPKEVNFS